MSRIGIFGGTFNPVHVAHLLVAEAVCEERALDTVLFVPAGWPPHKTDEPLAPAADRARMVELAVGDAPRFAVERLELAREGPSYTLLTVRELRDRRGAGNEMFLLLGGDSLLDLPNWWRADELVAEVRIIAFARPGWALREAWDGLAARFGRDWVDGVRESLVQVPLVDVSATDIRQRLRSGRSVRYMVPEAVRRYIVERGLYAPGR